MSKPTRDTQRRAGEQRLREWSVGADAGVDALRAVTGRDAAADLAIAARLGAHAEAASVDALLAMEASRADKLLHKEVRRSLYRLEQRGLTVPQAAPPKPATLAIGPGLEGYLSAVDGRGDQLVWLIKPRPSGVAHLFAVINDPDGLREVELSETTRKALRAARQELASRHDLRMVAADWHYCDYLIDRAFRWAAEKGHSVTGDYRGCRSQLTKEPVQALPSLARTMLDVEAVRADARLVAESEHLLEEKEFRTWFFDPEALRRYLDEAREIKESPLVLNEAQQQERVRAVIDRAVEELFGGDMQLSWVRRLDTMAYVFHATGRGEAAQRALAVALALESSTHGGRGLPFCETLARSSLAAFMQMEEQRQQEEAKGSLVVTPQQAAREMQRRG
jgi:ribosomal protein S18